MKRHAVPQNIMDVEFKLFGSLSMRQFGLLAGNVIIAIFIYIVVPPALDLIRWPIIIFFVALGLAMALLNVNGIPFTTWFSNFLLALVTSQKRVWKKSARRPDILKGSYKAEGKYTTHTVSKATKKDTPEMPLLSEEAVKARSKADKDEEADLLAIDDHFKKNFDSKSSKKQSDKDSLKSTNLPRKESVHKSSSPVTKKADQGLAVATDENFNNSFGIEGEETMTRVDTRINTSPPQEQSEIEEPVEKKTPIDVSEFEKEVEEKNEDDLEVETVSQKEDSPKEDKDDGIITQNELLEPVTEEAENTSQIKQNNKEEELQQKISELENQLKQLQSESKDDQNLHLQNEIAKQIDKVTDQIKNDSNTGVEDDSPVEEKVVSMKPSQKPNIISGIIISKDDVPIDGVSIEIKDDEGFPLRKVKTDRKGQFVIPTPLPNGEYLIDLEKKGRKFTDYRITLQGQILPVLKFKEEQ